VFRIPIWGIEAFSEMLSGDGTGISGPCDNVGPPQLGGMECGRYGSVCAGVASGSGVGRKFS